MPIKNLQLYIFFEIFGFYTKNYYDKPILNFKALAINILRNYINIWTPMFITKNYVFVFSIFYKLILRTYILDFILNFKVLAELKHQHLKIIK